MPENITMTNNPTIDYNDLDDDEDSEVFDE